MTLPIPTANQPIDYNFINTLVNEFNAISTEVAALNKNSTSRINGKTINQSSIVVFGADVQVLAPGTTATYSETTVSFEGMSFNTIPVVTATAKTDFNSITFSIGVSNVTKSGCKLSVTWGPKRPETPMTVSVLAIGERAV